MAESNPRLALNEPRFTQPDGVALSGPFSLPIYNRAPSTHALFYHPSTLAKIKGATMDASDSITNFGVCTPSLPHVIFSFGTAPE